MRLYYSIFILYALILSSCASVYAPQQALNVPLFSKARQFQGTFQYGFYSLKVQAAVAVTNHVALSVNGVQVNYASKNNFTQYQYQNLYEGTVGYYTANKSKSVLFEVFLGYGQGDGNYRDNTNPKDEIKNDHAQYGKYVQYVFQPTIGFGFGPVGRKIVQCSFTPRISYVDFSTLTTTIFNHPYSGFDNTEVTVTNPDPTLVFQPTTTARFNFLDNRLFFTLQLGLCVLQHGGTDGDNTPVVTSFPFTFSSGLGFRLGGLHWGMK